MTPDRLFRCLNWKVAYSEWGKSRIPMCWRLSCGAQLGQMDAEFSTQGANTELSLCTATSAGGDALASGVVWPQKSQEINESQFWAGGKVTEMNTARKLNSLPVTGCRNPEDGLSTGKLFAAQLERKQAEEQEGDCQISSTIAVILPRLHSWSGF